MKNIILTFLIFSSSICLSQSNNEKETAKKIMHDAGVFLLEKGEIDSTDNLEKKMSIIEILENKVLGYNDTGVYRLYPHKSPSFTYIILKNGANFKILDLKDFSKALEEMSKFFSSSKLEANTIVNYMEKVLEVYRNNNYDAKIRW